MAKPANGNQRRGGKKNRKFGRNKKFCTKYRANNTRGKNKVRKLVRHLKVNRADFKAVGAWKRATGQLKKAA